MTCLVATYFFIHFLKMHREKYLFDSNIFCLNQTYFIFDIRSNKCLFDLNTLFVCLNLLDLNIGFV